MVDREHGHNERDFWNKASEGLGSFQELSGISNKTLVSLLIFGLIIILCVAYVFEIKKSRSAASGQGAGTAVTAVEAAPAGEAAAPGATGEAAAAEEEAAPAKE